MKTSIKFMAKVESKEWAHFSWSVSINGETFEYKTGIGHATPRHAKTFSSFNKKPLNSVLVGDEWAHIPSIDDVLECLFSDTEMGAYSFDDFCDNCGYSNDSLKALDIYRACAEIGKRLRKALGAEYDSERKRIDNRAA